MREAEAETKKPGKFRRFSGRVLGIWAYPVVAPARQLRDTTRAIKEMAAAASGENGKPRAESFDDALSRRAADAMPLEQMEKAFRSFKNLSVFFLWASLASAGANLILFLSVPGVMMSMALAALSFAFSFRFNLRIWQLRHRRLLPMPVYKQENPDWLMGCFKFV